VNSSAIKAKSTKSIKSVHAAPAAKQPAPTQPEAPPQATTAPSAPAPVSPSPSPAPQSFAARVAAAVEAITNAKSALGLDTVLSPTQIKRAVKFKKGGEQHVPTLAGLSAKYGVEVPSRPTADMTTSLEKATQLEPARAAIGELSKIVDDAYFDARSDTWTTATSLYSMLKKGSIREPGLASALQPLQEYFAHRHPLVAAEHPKRSPAKAVDKQQQKVHRRIARLQTQLAQLQAVVPPSPSTQEQPAPAQPAPVAPAAPAAHSS
jgi:hypothetical protein